MQCSSMATLPQQASVDQINSFKSFSDNLEVDTWRRFSLYSGFLKMRSEPSRCFAIGRTAGFFQGFAESALVPSATLHFPLIHTWGKAAPETSRFQMKFSQSSFVYLNYPLAEAIRQMHEHGYEGIEIWGGRPHAYRHDLKDEMDRIVGLLDQLEMAVPNFIPAQFRYPSILCSTNEKIRGDSVRYIQDAIDNARRLGAPSVSLCPGMTLQGESSERGWSQFRKSILELLDYTGGTDLVLLIEPAHSFETTLVLTVADGLRMVREIGSERLGILVDTGHCHVNGEDLAQVIGSVKDVPFHIHVDDNQGDSDVHAIPGEGNTEFAPLVKALAEINYQGFVSAELGFQYTLDPDQAVKKTYAQLCNIFG